MLDDIIRGAEGMSPLELRKAIEMLKVLVLRALRGSDREPERCPFCGSAIKVRRGVDKRRDPETGKVVEKTQRWLCVSCGRSYTRKSMGILAYSKLGADKWTKFVELMCKGSSIKWISKKLKVSTNTVHFMRARVCEVMAQATPQVTGGEGVSVQVDGTYFNESLKGLGRRHRATMPREAHRTGHDVRKRGISDEKVCVLCGVDDAGNTFAVLCDRGRPSDERIRECLEGRLAPGTVVSTDRHEAYDRVLPELGVTNHLRFRSDGSDGNGLWRVNNLHKRLADWLRPFNGVSTRYLQLYCMWFQYAEYVRRTETLDLEEELQSLVANGRYVTTRRELYGAKRPFWDYWKDKMATVDELPNLGEVA